MDEQGNISSRDLGLLTEIMREQARMKARDLERDLRIQAERTIVTAAQGVENFKVERTPERFSTRYGYTGWLKNHILPKGEIVPSQSWRLIPLRSGSSPCLFRQRAGTHQGCGFKTLGIRNVGKDRASGTEPYEFRGDQWSIEAERETSESHSGGVSMRHSDIRTTMNVYGDVVTDEMRHAHARVVRMALPRAN